MRPALLTNIVDCHLDKIRIRQAVHLVANFDQGVAERVSAGDVVKEIAPIVGGGGGGRPTMARAGGKNPEQVPEALARAKELISAALS